MANGAASTERGAEERERPTVKQVYALAAALCERMGEELPGTRAGASEVIERLRVENGHPRPRLEDVPGLRAERARRGVRTRR